MVLTPNAWIHQRWKKDGTWASYHDNGQLNFKGTYKEGERDGPWVGCTKGGTVWEFMTGNFKDGEKVN